MTVSSLKRDAAILTGLLCGWITACAPPITTIAVRCGAGTMRDPQTQTCVIETGETTETTPCGPRTRLDAQAQVCVGVEPVIECGPGTALTRDGQSCVQSGMHLYCDRGTERSADRTECVLAARDVIICGDGTQVGSDQRCAPTNAAVELEPIETAPLNFDISDAQMANETIVHLLNRENDQVVRVDLSDGRVLDPIAGRLPLLWMEVIPETGDVYLLHEQRIDLYRAATREISVFAATEAPITSATRVGDTLLVTTGSRIVQGEAALYDLRTGERDSSWAIGPHGEARGIYVATHAAVVLSQTNSFPPSMYRIDLSQEAPQIETARSNGLRRNGPLHYNAAADGITSSSGQLFDPNTLELTGGLGMPIADVIERRDGVYALTAAEVNGNHSAYLVVQDAVGNQLSQTRIGDAPRALLMVAGQLHVIGRTDGHLQILRMR
jgi:hypothetical protein